MPTPVVAAAVPVAVPAPVLFFVAAGGVWVCFRLIECLFACLSISVCLSVCLLGWLCGCLVVWFFGCLVLCAYALVCVCGLFVYLSVY